MTQILNFFTAAMDEKSVFLIPLYLQKGGLYVKENENPGEKCTQLGSKIELSEFTAYFYLHNLCLV